MKNNWIIKKTDKETTTLLAKNTGYSFVTSALLIERGVSSPEKVKVFFDSSLSSIKSPFLLKDMDKAVKIITGAVKEKKRILIFGDYDVDGVTATTILYNFLKYINADVSYYIPHRIHEGYSFQEPHVANVLVPGKIDLVITVDCGSDSYKAIRAASENGIDVIITDHHRISGLPPSAVAIINPHQPDCESGLEHLAGVGVAFYLIIALRKHFRDIQFWKNIPEPNLKTICDLVALGTIADIVPLIDENRAITKAGLNVINSAPGIGLQAMIKAGKINKEVINSIDVAFKIAPRINAAGRLRHAGMVVDLLCEKDFNTACSTAETLNSLNGKRQALELKTLEEIINYIEEKPSILDNKSIVLYKQGWHIGVLGIVASRLVNKYHRPAILIALDGTTGKGSGRSIPGTNLFNLLSECSDTLEGFGGHAMAAGLSIKTSNLGLFTKKVNTIINTELKESILQKNIKIDYKIKFEEITPELLDELEMLHPFGAGNPEPLFISDSISIVSASIVGNKHRRLVLTSGKSGNDNHIMAMHFNSDTTESYPNHFEYLVFKLQWNRWNKSKSIQIIIEDYL